MRFTPNRIVIGTLLFVLLLWTSALATKPTLNLFNYRAIGLDEIGSPGAYTLKISVEALPEYAQFGNKVSITIKAGGNLQLLGPSEISAEAKSDEPLIFEIPIRILDNDTCGFSVLVQRGAMDEYHSHHFVSENGTTKIFTMDPRQFNDIMVTDPRHPDNQVRPNTTWVDPHKPRPEDEPIADSIIINPNDSTKKIRYYSDKPTPEQQRELDIESERAYRDRIPIPQTNEPWKQSVNVGDSIYRRSSQDTAWRSELIVTIYDPIKPKDTAKERELAEQTVHFSLSLQDSEQYDAAAKLLGTLEPMDSTGFYHAWGKMKISRELAKLQIPHKEYPNYPSRYFRDPSKKKPQ